MWEERLKIYDEIVSQCPDIVRKGKSVPYTSANGHMFSFINKAGDLGMRFSLEDQDKYMNEFSTSFFESHGATMKGYILITDAMLKDKDLLIRLLRESHNYVKSLKSK